MSRVITDTITTSATDNEGGAVTAPVRFLYDGDDPYCITLDLTALSAAAQAAHGKPPLTDPVVWSFARSLITEALIADGRYGLGNVVVERERAWVAIHIASSDGRAELRFTHFALMRFMQRTAALVPFGQESNHLDVDAAIHRLMRPAR